MGNQQRYGEYEVVKPLARGGMSTVYIGKDVRNGAQVAIKILNATSSEVLKRLSAVFEAEEGKIAMSLESPYVVKTLDYGRKGQVYYIVMEYIDGPNVRNLVKARDPRLDGLRVKVVLQAGRGLAYIHNMGLIHRDFNPKNILLTPQNNAKIIDFGLTIPAGVGQRRTIDQSGTASYMAPEQIRRQRIDVRADVYAFGVSAFEILTGKRPFPERAGHERKMQAHLNIQPAVPSEIDPSLPKELDPIILQSIQKRPEDRYPSMDVMMKDLQRVVDKHYRQSGAPPMP